MNWRALSVPPSPKVLSPVLPLQLPMSNNPGLSHISNGNNNPLLITARAIFLLTPVNASKQTSWVVMAEEVDPGTFQLYHPITGIPFQLSGKHFDIRQFKVTELSRHASLRNSKYLGTKFVLRDEAALALPVNSSMGSLTRIPTSNSNNNQGMSLWHYRIRERSLQPHRTWTTFLIFDIERFNGMFVALHKRGMLYALDYLQDYYYPVVKRGTLAYDQFTNREHYFRRRRLVVDPVSQNLHLVDKEFGKCRVYVLNEQQKRWDKIESLGDDNVLFVGVDHCFFARTQHLSGCPGNCVVYVDDSFYPIDDIHRSSLFDANGVEDRIRVYLLDEKKTNMISHYPEFFQLLCLPSSSWFF